MITWRFSKFDPNAFHEHPFETLLKLFKELLMHTNGDVAEALQWLTELDRQYNLTDDDYGIADFIQDLKDKGLIHPDSPVPA